MQLEPAGPRARARRCAGATAALQRLRQQLPLVMALALGWPAGAGAATGATQADVHPVAPPGADALFAEIGLATRGSRRQFIVGDNRSGYYDGMTGGYRLRPGYLVGAEALLQDHATYVDGRLLDRRGAGADEVVYPYGRTLASGGARETMVLHAGTRRLSVELRSDAPALLAVQPLWAFDLRQATLRWHDGVLLVVPPGAPTWVVAVAGDQPFELLADAGDGVDASPRLQARARGRALTLHFAFARTADDAQAQAAAMAASPGLIARSIQACRDRLTRSWLWTSDRDYNRALVWAKASSLSFLVDEHGRGLWAGLPWFRENWGRDTFISLPGTLLVSGHLREAREVLENFARFQNLRPVPMPAAGAAPAQASAGVAAAEGLAIGPRASDYGRIPNRVSGDEIIYNTVDGTPWMLREALEYVRYSGDRAFAARALALAGPYIEGALRHSVDADGLLVHEDADTWMDARIEGRQAWSPRGARAVEIQALWFTALESAAALADLSGQAAALEQARAWRARAAQARASFLRLYWDGRTLADRLRPDGRRDLQVRPNQLMVVSVPFSDFVPPEVGAAVVRNATRELLFPYGIASLSPHDPDFHPHHVDDAHHHKDAAYHNGTIWGWNAGFTVTGLARFGRQDLAYALSRNLAGQILDLGTLGTMSELLDALPDAQGRPHPSGTFSQAWSVAEFERNAFQDYLGFRPDLPANRLHFVPALPTGWRHFDAVLPYGPGAAEGAAEGERDGAGEALTIHARRSGTAAGATWHWQFALRDAATARDVVLDSLAVGNARRRAVFTLAPGQVARVQVSARGVRLDGRALPTTQVAASQDRVLGHLQFATPPRDDPAAFPVTRGKDVLEGLILGERRR